MMTGNADNASVRTALARAVADLATPRILIAEDQPAIQELLCCRIEDFRPCYCISCHDQHLTLVRSTPPVRMCFHFS